ncbi:RNA 2',3'-cyclic phosphodiesterase [Leptospira sp. 201903070]|uniref:RNA 2',3'-cyclic phosphodiesterase n=1 Tax=Leptospira ainlahdjerensis TaxID=2810033 RepID=A0ABS2UID5_9LEPT|nr:RNA 2',3'-cyclic phosphodiesterase [Leptospira ainlahdjerensis]MBM9579107.1 RNA 2',3'-cyclic phosphodiesterase [Leptospira ainlahdjerensis]
MRTFLGISIPDEVKEQLTSICYGLPDIKWVREENFHITLVFLGEQGSDDIDRISEFCSRISLPDFDLRLQSVGFFGKQKSPSILFANVEKNSNLLQLQKTLDSGLRKRGFNPERQEYHPHVTIGRFKNANGERISLYLEEFTGFSSSRFPVLEFHIYSSKSSSDGPIYTIEESFSLLPSYRDYGKTL